MVIIRNIKFLFLILIIGCYSFTGGSVPEYLKTINIEAVEDVSGFGDPTYRDLLNDLLITDFEDDGTFRIVQRNSDARLVSTIKSIREEPVAVSQGELESERKITIVIEVEYTDLVMKKTIWTKNFTNFGIFDISNAQAGRQDALNTAIEQASIDILFAVVSGW